MTTTSTAADPRRITGWAAADMTLSPRTLNAMAANPHYAAPVSGDAKPRPAWLVLNHSERIDLINKARKAGIK